MRKTRHDETVKVELAPINSRVGLRMPRPKYDEMKPREGEAHSPYATKQSSSMRMILFIVIAWILILVAMLFDALSERSEQPSTAAWGYECHDT